jgi:LPS-assembly protein
MHRAFTALAVALAFAAPAGAQVKKPDPFAAAAPAKSALTSVFEPADGVFHISSEDPVEIAQGYARYRKFVILTGGDLRIEADEADYFDTRKPDGTGGRRVEARGNVVFMRGKERIAGETLVMDLETGKGQLTNARGYVNPGVFFEADSVERLAATKYRVRGGRFTSCFQPSPRWSFSAHKADLKVDDHLLATWVNFKIKGVPTPLILPAFYYPIQEDQRSTGFLFPSLGYSSALGFTTGGGFFWAMSRSVDQTIQYVHFSKYGDRVTHEFRYMRKSPSSGTFSSEFTWPKLATGEASGREYRLNWNATQMLPLALRAQLSVNETSSTNYQNRVNENFAELTNRFRSSSFNIQRNIGRTTLQLNVDRNDTTFPVFRDNEYIDIRQRRERLPSVRVARPSQRIGRTGFTWGVDARAEQLGLGDENGTDRFSRYDFSPEISRPIAASFLQLTPRLKVRYTQWGGLERVDNPDTTDVDEGGFFSERWDRRYVEGALEMRGPTFSRVFMNPTGAYTDRIKHVIGPEVTFVRRRLETTLEDNETPPVFDGDDLLPETTEVRYGLVQRFLAKRPGANGKPAPHEFLVWRISQTYYAQEEASKFDSQYYSSLFDEGQEPTKFSPIQTNVRFRPSTRLSSNFTHEYDIQRRRSRSLSVSANLDLDRLGANVGWTRSMQLFNNPAKNRPMVNTINGRSRLDLVPRKVRLEASSSYNVLEHRFMSQTFSLRYDVQCCGFFVERRQLRYGTLEDRQFRFQVQLANIGSVGNFGQDDGYGPRGQAYGGKR